MGKRITIAVAEELKRRLLGAGKGTVRKERVKGRLSGDKRKGKGELSTGAEKFSVVEGKSVDKLSTIAEFFSVVNLKDVDNSLKYAYLMGVINSQVVFGGSSSFLVFLALLVLEFTRGVIDVSQAELGAITGISERSIRKILGGLREMGILVVDRRRNAKAGESLVYRILHRRIFPLCCYNFFNYYNVGNFRWKNFPTEKISDDEVIKGEGKFRTIRIDTLIKQYGKDRVYQAMDMLNNQYRDREIAHPYRLIKKMLDDQSFVHNRFYMQFRGRKVGEVVPIYIECSGCGHRGISELRVGNKNRYNETR